MSIRNVNHQLMKEVLTCLSKVSKSIEIKEEENDEKICFNFAEANSVGIDVIYDGSSFDCECRDRMAIDETSGFTNWNETVLFIFEIVSELNDIIFRKMESRKTLLEYLRNLARKEKNSAVLNTTSFLEVYNFNYQEAAAV